MSTTEKGALTPTITAFLDGTFWPDKANLSPTTLKLYHDYCDRIIIPFFDGGREPIGKIDHSQIQRMINSCSTYNIAEKSKEILSSILGYACDPCRIIEYNPAVGKYSFPDGADPGIPEYGTVLKSFRAIRDYIDAVHEAMPGTYFDIGMSVDFSYGLRPGEVCGLDESSFNFDEDYVDIAASYSNFSNLCVYKSTKTRKVRRMPLFPYIKNLLIGFGVDPDHHAPLLVNSRGERVTESQLRKRLIYHRRRLGLPDVTLLSVRHSVATSMLLSGIPLPLVSLWLGHASLQTTMNYIDVKYDELVDVSKVMNALMANPRDPGIRWPGELQPLNVTNEAIVSLLGTRHYEGPAREVREAIDAYNAQFYMQRDGLAAGLGDDAGIGAESVPRAVPNGADWPKARTKNSDIVALLTVDPGLSASEIANRLGSTRSLVKHRMSELQMEGVIEHTGPARGGSWRIVA